MGHPASTTSATRSKVPHLLPTSSKQHAGCSMQCEEHARVHDRLLHCILASAAHLHGTSADDVVDYVLLAGVSDALHTQVVCNAQECFDIHGVIAQYTCGRAPLLFGAAMPAGMGERERTAAGAHDVLWGPSRRNLQGQQSMYCERQHRQGRCELRDHPGATDTPSRALQTVCLLFE